ncbi:MAG: SpoIIE family protein phosphatase [Treponema sp.]|nr:SpoIIE family protein phosphatase [Treponema sp.]
MKKRFKTLFLCCALLWLFPAAHTLSAQAAQGNPQTELSETNATIKSGDYSRTWQPSWNFRPERKISFNTGLALIAGLIVLSVIGLFAVVRGLGSAAAESAEIQAEARALITGDFMPAERKRQIARVKKRGTGLRFKIASFTIVLVLFVVVMISAPLYYLMVRTQRETLLRGLWDRSSVLLEGLRISVGDYLSAGDRLGLSVLPAQAVAIPEARYVTISSYRTEGGIITEPVWATNDPDILSKIDIAEFRPGVSRLSDTLSPRVEYIARELNELASMEAGDIARSIIELRMEALSLVGNSDIVSRIRRDEIGASLEIQEIELEQSLGLITRQMGSEPFFSTSNIPPEGDRRFIFFKPIMYQQNLEDHYFRGLIRMEVSIDSIIADIYSKEMLLLRTILFIALMALVIGIIGALAFSSLIIRPIRKLVRHVEIIRDTEDKIDLAGMNIRFTSDDEIAVLGNTINEMTQGLVQAAMAASDLSVGKEIQKMFLPLEVDHQGNKLNSGHKDTRNAQFFGYYEGAGGISGDYFDYQDLDGRYYAIIKCDIAGKGIPAALIMIQVATLFLNYCKRWKLKTGEMQIVEVVYEINDFIEDLGFKGRFAAFTLCLFDSSTGVLHFCNAGDNIIHLFDTSEDRLKALTLPETPAAGALPNATVESMGGYHVQTHTLDHGDILLLYTDGIEESKREFRDSECKNIVCTEGPDDTPHQNHLAGQGYERMGATRIQNIINALMNQRHYTLYKWHSPEEDRELHFDFTACEGNVEELIMALISVEKIFRCYRDPEAGNDARVLVDKKVNAFLKAHFLQYREYCAHTSECPGNNAYMYYTHLREDEQYDDLTILGIRRK